MTPFRRPVRVPGTTRVPAQQPADTLVMPAAETSIGLDTDRYPAGLTTVMMRRVPKRSAARLGLSVTAAVSGTVVASVLNVPPQFRVAAAVVGAALPAFMTEPGRFQRQRFLAAGLLTVAALFVTYSGTTAFSYLTGKPSVYLGRPAAPAGPWAVIRAYYHDITVRDYKAAWRLRGPRLRAGGYANFVAGYAGTGRQVVREVSVSGDRASFALRSDNPDGTVQTFWGTDTVTGGKIVAASVAQTSGPKPA
jgi:hypothetical protein